MNICVLFGGDSCESDISIITGLQAIENLNSLKYNIYPIFIKNKRFFLPKNFESIETYTNWQEKLHKEIVMIDSAIFLKRGDKLKLIKKIDCVLVCLHGGLGENGAISGFLECNNFVYTSSSNFGCAVCMDKIATKLYCDLLDINYIPYKAIFEQDSIENASALATEIGYPVIVKPSRQGSSIGIGIAHNNIELQEAVVVAKYYDKQILIEKALENFEEINCAIVGKNGELLISSLEKPMGAKNILTFEDKYMDNGKMNGSTRVFPYSLGKEKDDYIHNCAEKLYSTLQMQGVVRFDFLYDKVEKVIYLNEVNTIPGSLAGYLFANKGVSYGGFLDYLIGQALSSKKQDLPKFSSSVLLNYNKAKRNACKNNSKLL